MRKKIKISQYKINTYKVTITEFLTDRFLSSGKNRHKYHAFKIINCVKFIHVCTVNTIFRNIKMSSCVRTQLVIIVSFQLHFISEIRYTLYIRNIKMSSSVRIQLVISITFQLNFISQLHYTFYIK